TALSTLALDYFFLPSPHSATTGVSDAARLAIFACVALLIGGLYTARVRAQKRLAVALESERQVCARLESADREKDNFLAWVVHELRTPLASLRTPWRSFVGRV